MRSAKVEVVSVGTCQYYRTVQEEGWSGLENGELLAQAEPGFDVLVSVDKGLKYQQNLTGRRMAIVVIRAKTNRLVDLEPRFPVCAEVLSRIQAGQVIEVP